MNVYKLLLKISNTDEDNRLENKYKYDKNYYMCNDCYTYHSHDDITICRGCTKCIDVCSFALYEYFDETMEYSMDIFCNECNKCCECKKFTDIKYLIFNDYDWEYPYIYCRKCIIIGHNTFISKKKFKQFINEIKPKVKNLKDIVLFNIYYKEIFHEDIKLKYPALFRSRFFNISDLI